MKILTAKGYSFHQIGERDNQEDSRYPNTDVSQPGQMFFVVCDGVGGSEKGELASSIVASRFGKRLSKMNFNEEFTDNHMLAVLDDAYIALDAAADDSNRDMGTTLTFLCFHVKGCVMAHIGDSRIYHIRPQEGILYRSDDHSLVNQMVRAGQLTPEEAINHPHRNVITRCMSPTNDDQRRSMATVFRTTNVKEGDYFVLCSDGVVSCIADDELVGLLEKEESDEKKVEELAKLCDDSADNNTAWVVRINKVEYTDQEQEALDAASKKATDDKADSDDEVDTLRKENSDISMSELESVTRGKKTFFGRLRGIFD